MPRLDDSRKGRYSLLWVVASASVQISPEDTWVSFGTQEDHGIGERLEVWGDPTYELLTDLLRPSISDRLRIVSDMGTYSTANSTRVLSVGSTSFISDRLTRGYQRGYCTKVSTRVLGEERARTLHLRDAIEQ